MLTAIEDPVTLRPTLATARFMLIFSLDITASPSTRSRTLFSSAGGTASSPSTNARKRRPPGAEPPRHLTIVAFANRRATLRSRQRFPPHDTCCSRPSSWLRRPLRATRLPLAHWPRLRLEDVTKVLPKRSARRYAVAKSLRDIAVRKAERLQIALPC